MNATQEQLDALFPTPSSPPTALAPGRYPGCDYQSTKTLVELLKDNHKRWHIFFNDRGFHNHSTHHLLSIYAMGADSATLCAAYEVQVAMMKPAFDSPGPIDQSNWKDHLGDWDYYQGYLKFFTSLILSSSTNSVLEEYIMSKEANIVPGSDGKAPLMLSRFLAGFLHPLIHAGYGFEYGLPGLVAEGIAQTAIHAVEAEDLFSAEMFDVNTPDSDGVASRLASLALTSQSQNQSSTGPHALTVLAKVANDPALSPSAIGIRPSGAGGWFEQYIKLAGPKIAEYASQWTVVATEQELAAKFEEIIWSNTIIYTVGGWAGRKLGGDVKGAFDADFFLMHLVTSAAMVSSILGAAKPSSASLLLKTYFLFTLIVYVARGRPPLPIADFYQETTARPSAPGSVPQSAEKTIGSAASPNSWLPIIQTTLVHPDEHLCKIQRALAHSAVLYAGTPPGTFSRFADHGLKGAEVLDDTLFVRAAGLTAERLGWMREGEGRRDWDRGGYYRLK